MFLATTAATELWDEDEDLVLLGPGCLRYDRMATWTSLRFSMAPALWSQPDAVAEAERVCDAALESVLVHLAAAMNKIHDVSHGIRYWRLLLEPWLLYYAHALYDRHASLRRVFQAHSNIRTVVLSPLSYRTPGDTADFISLAYGESSDIYNLQLYSQALRALGRDGASDREVEIASEAGHRPRLASRHAVAVRLVPRLVRALRPSVLLGNVGLDRLQLLRLIAALGGSALPLPSMLPYTPSGIDAIKRKELAEIPARNEFEAVLLQSLSVNLPTVYLEDYARLRDRCLKLWPHTPSVVLSSTGWLLNEPFKFLAAEFAERGATLIGMQHGGGYGTSSVHPLERFELTVCDRWLSFGWGDDHKEGKIRAMPHPRFLRGKSARAAGRHGGDILLIANSVPRFVYRFESVAAEDFVQVLDWRERFVLALPAAVRDRLVVRLNRDDYGWYQKQRLMAAASSISFDESGRAFRDALLRARMAVVEYYGTAYLECLALDRPTVIFWNDEFLRLREEARPFFDALREAGILCHTPEAAAARVADVSDAPEGWWNSDIVQRARRRFVERFARGRGDWLKAWLDMLRAEVRR